MKKIKTFKVKTLDFAGYLWTLGYRCVEVRKLGLNNAEFMFEDPNGDIRKNEIKFLEGKVTVNLTNFLYGRTQLKFASNKLPIPTIATIDRYKSIKQGDAYWYLNGAIPLAAVFAEKEPHMERLLTGNLFHSKEAAMEFAKIVK